MGTRHMTGVVIDGDFKVAQYGQWDGYPSGQGKDILAFLRTVDLPDFVKKVRALRFATDQDEADTKARWAEVGAGDSDGWVTMEQSEQFYANPRFAPLSRDVGSKVLTMVANDQVEFLHDSRDFALDSLFCEWAYVIDLDNCTLEVYQGFQNKPHDSGRWAGQLAEDQEHRDDPYYPVKLVKTYSLVDLPSDEDFVSALEKENA